MHLGRNIQYLRKRNGSMTQEQLSERMGVSRQTISKWESGENYPEMSKLLELCTIFSCSLDALVREDLSQKSVSFQSVQILRVQGFRYAAYTVISKNPMEDSRNHMNSWAMKYGLDRQNSACIGWKFPYLSHDQKQRFGLRGYVSAFILPDNFDVHTQSVDICAQETADYAVLTIQNPHNADRIHQAYGDILEFLSNHGIQKQHTAGILPCFERIYQQNGIPCMDIFIHCHGPSSCQVINLHEFN